MNGTALAAAVAVAGITYDEVHNLGRMPCPARYLYVVGLFGGIGLIFGAYPGFAAIVSWAFVAALILEAVSPPSEGGLGRTLQTAVSGISRRPKQHGGGGDGGKPPKHRTRGGKQV